MYNSYGMVKVAMAFKSLYLYSKLENIIYFPRHVKLTSQEGGELMMLPSAACCKGVRSWSHDRRQPARILPRRFDAVARARN